jgi:hypothetical protein
MSTSGALIAMPMGSLRGPLRRVLLVTLIPHSILAYSLGWNAANATTPLTGARRALTCLIPVLAVKMAA